MDTTSAKSIARSSSGISSSHHRAAEVWVPGWDAVFGPPRLSEAERQALAPLLRSRRVMVGEAVFQRGQSATHLVAVVEGTPLGPMPRGLSFSMDGLVLLVAFTRR